MNTVINPRAAIRRLNLAGCIALVVGLGGMAAWATATTLSGAVIAPGTVVVETSVKKIQHLNGGIVKEILVTEGSVVDAAQVLVRLDDTLTRATLGVIRSQLELYVAREARLIAEQDGRAIDIAAPTDVASGGNASDNAILGEQRLLQSRRDGLTAQRAQLRERIAQSHEEIAGLSAQQRSKESEIDYIGEELAGVSQLYSKNLVSTARLKQLQRDQARAQGERGQLIADIARSRGKIAEIEVQLLQLDHDFRTDVLKDLRETQAKIAELRERENAALDELRHTEIRAPQAGIVYQLRVHTIGGIIAKGDTVMQIAPRSDPLIVEARVSPQEIDQVEIGASVRVRLGAGNRRTMPDIDGKVTVVSPDLTRDAQSAASAGSNEQYYLARVALAEAETRTVGGLQLVPGMPVEVFIHTRDRTALDYLVEPVREQVGRAFRER